MNKTRTAAQPLPPWRIPGPYRICGRPGQNDRPPLPAGHPVCWGLLTDGTVLDGAEYPYPVFPD